MRIFFKTDPRIHYCPECKKQGGLKKSRSRNLIEKIIKIISPYSTFRCKLCGWRGYKSAYLFNWKSVQAIFIYILLIAATIIIVGFVLKRFIIN